MNETLALGSPPDPRFILLVCWTVTMEPATVTTTSTPAVVEEKVKVHFVAVGSAPILKKAKFQISADKRFSAVYAFLRKMLKLPDGAGLLLYCQSAFCPSPDQLVGDLKDAFAVRDELVVHYSFQEAWG